MINENSFIPDESFYAAANGYSGFRSLFGEVFNSKRFLRVFVLKGGPGTGKSTLMKTILKSASCQPYHTKAIYCSSDPHSLDGVIIRSAKGSVAILDGTAPHERDAIIPGAIDEIINLGEGFDIERLSKRRREILDLTTQKSHAYNMGYAYLRACGHIKRLIRDILSKNLDYSAAEVLIDKYILDATASKFPTNEKYYISSFGKMGYQRITSHRRVQLKTTRIGGDVDLSIILNSYLEDRLMSRGLVKLVCPSPFDDTDIEAFESDDRLFITTDEDCFDIDAREILRATIPMEVIKLRSTERVLLDLAEASMREASNAHFALEAIYTPCVDFSHNERLTAELLEKINYILR